MQPRQPISTLFPYTTLFRSIEPTAMQQFTQFGVRDFTVQYWDGTTWQPVDGKSTRLNSSDRCMAYAVLLTKKNIRIQVTDALAGTSRLVEVEAYTTGPVNPP